MTELMMTSVKLEPGKIELENRDLLNKRIDETLKKYENTVVSVETEKEAKKQRAELNKVKLALESFRIEKKKIYLEPLDAFEDDVKSLVIKLDKVIGEIGAGLKELDELQRAERNERVEELIIEYGKGFEIIRKPSWLNKTAKEAHTIDDIKDQVREFEFLAKQRLEAIDTIREVCETNDLTPDGYIQLLESGAGDVMQIVKSINEAARAKRERIEREKELAQLAEQKKQQEDEYNAETARIKEKEENIEPLPAPTKEEVVDEVTTHNPEPFETGEVFTNVLELRGTMTQFRALNEALINSGVHIRELATEDDYKGKLIELFGYEG